jgi:Glycosyl transferase family 2
MAVLSDPGANGNGRGTRSHAVSDPGMNGNGHAAGLQSELGTNGNGHAAGSHGELGTNGNGHAAGPQGELGTNGNGHVRLGRPIPARQVLVSVVIPTLNEARNLPHVLPRIPHWIDEVVLVDGGSEDGTVEVARTLLPEIQVVHELRPGKGAALRTGFSAARGDIIVTLDADGSTDPAEIPAFVGCLLAGADFAKGSRFVQGGGTADMELIRRAGNWGLQRLVRVAFGGRYSDLCYGYNAFWRHVLPVIDGEADGFEIETLMNVRVLAAGMRVAEVASHEAPRIHGQSHLKTFRDGFRVLRTIIRERRRALRRPVTATARAAGWDRRVLVDRRVAAPDRRSQRDRRSEVPALPPGLKDRRSHRERRIASRDRRSQHKRRASSLGATIALSSNGRHDREKISVNGH